MRISMYELMILYTTTRDSLSVIPAGFAGGEFSEYVQTRREAVKAISDKLKKTILLVEEES